MKLKFEEKTGLIPAIIQDEETHKVLMLGYMNQESLDKTMATGKVTFFSRSKNRLRTKGEESGNFLRLVSLQEDCDSDALLVKVHPAGPTCHKGTDTCWREENVPSFGFLTGLERVIAQRQKEAPEGSYVASLFDKGINKIAQKVGEEAVELVIEAKDQDDELFRNEAADLLFHYLILLRAKGYGLKDVAALLKERHK